MVAVVVCTSSWHGPVLAEGVTSPRGEVRNEANAKLDTGGRAITGTITSQDLGDTACYLTLRSDRGTETALLADFELCVRHPGLPGKTVELGFASRQVMDESCGGSPACKKTRRVQVATTVNILGGTVQAAAMDQPSERASNCTANELVVFACRTGVKLVSVCADPASGPDNGYMQYRFGRLGNRDALEVNWPDDWLPPQAVATGSAEALSGGGVAWLRIRKGTYAYVVYSGIGRWGPNGRTQTKEGIVVEHHGKTIASIKCTQPATSELGPAWFDKVGVRSRGEIFALPD